MEKHAWALLQLLACVLCGAMCVSGLVTTGKLGKWNCTTDCLSWLPLLVQDTEESAEEQDTPLLGNHPCNETLILESLPICGKKFEDKMKKLDSKKWCNLTEFIMHYDKFSQCTENKSIEIGCFWPNRHTECYITGIHKQFFSNCTSDKVVWEDPPEEILTTLILVPILLTAAMIALVVWCSKRSDIFM